MSVVKGVPVIGDMLDSSTNKLIEELQKKEQEFIDVVLKDKHTITSDIVNDVEFIVNYNRTLEIVRRLAINDKAKYFGNLIRNGYLSDSHVENNEFEEYLDALNTMSERELEYLVFLKEHPVGKNDVISWQKFEKIFSEQFGGLNEKPYFIYLRLKRTGFVDEEYRLYNTSISKDSAGDYELDWDKIESHSFSVTALFDCFCKMILGIYM